MDENNTLNNQPLQQDIPPVPAEDSVSFPDAVVQHSPVGEFPVTETVSFTEEFNKYDAGTRSNSDNMPVQETPVIQPVAVPKQPQPQSAQPYQPEVQFVAQPAPNYGYPQNPGFNYPPAPVYTPKVAQDPKSKGGKKGLFILIAILVAVAICISSMAIGFYASNTINGLSDNNPFDSIIGGNDDNNGGNDQDIDPDGSESSFPINQNSKKDVEEGTPQTVAKAATPSIVSITIYSTDTKTGGYASGIIMSSDGYILTNDHIYSTVPNAKFLITLNDGTEYHAKFVSGDTRSDIAILKITDNVNNLKPATFGKSSECTVGESVLIIGQSSGLSDTVTDGIISALDRRVRNSHSSYSEKHIQTSAAINPGNSGGALVNMQGQVVGVASSKYVNEDIEAVCFAIPIDRALSVVAELQKYGKVESRARLGITYTTIGTVTAEINSLPTGLLIQEIDPQSGLYNKGFSKGDIITHINGQKLDDDHVILDIIENSEIGDRLKLTIYSASSKESEDFTVELIKSEGGNSYTTNIPNESSSNNIFDIIPYPDQE